MSLPSQSFVKLQGHSIDFATSTILSKTLDIAGLVAYMLLALISHSFGLIKDVYWRNRIDSVAIGDSKPHPFFLSFLHALCDATDPI